MKVKRFFAADMRTAMKLVRMEMGAEASIIANRRVAGGIELTAALDYEAPRLTPPTHGLDSELKKTQERILEARASLQVGERPAGGSSVDRQLFGEHARQPAEQDSTVARDLLDHVDNACAESAFEGQTQIASTGGDNLDNMRSEIAGLRDLLESQLGGLAWGQVSQHQPRQAGLWRRLIHLGLPAELCKELLARVAEIADVHQAWRMLLAHLAQSIPVTREEFIEQGGVVALVGPTGAGKTTTLGKLAARYVLKHGSQHVALVTMDTYRIGAHEQLRTLGRILNVPVRVVDEQNSLDEVLGEFAGKRLVLIDTAGLQAQDPQLQGQLKELAAQGTRIRTLLVLAATSQYRVLKAAWQSYRSCGLAGCVLTKVDEACSLGEALGLAMQQRLPVAYMADGQRIPDDLSRGAGHKLVSRAVSLAGNEMAEEQTMADAFAGILHTQRAS